jgi:hypothetical protein
MPHSYRSIMADQGGLSSGATLAAIAQKLPELPKGASVIGFNYETGEFVSFVSSW